MGTKPGVGTRVGMRIGTSSCASWRWGRSQGTGVWLTRFPWAGDLDQGPDWFGDRAEVWRSTWQASPDSVIYEFWLSPISALVIEAKTTDMNSRAHGIGIIFLKTVLFSMKVFTVTPGFWF